MRTINANELIDKSKFNSYFLLVFLTCTIIRLFDGYEMNMFGVVIPELTKNGQMTATQAGLLASYSFIGMIFGSILFGTLNDKIGTRHSIAICTIVYACFTGLCGFANSHLTFAVCRFIAGVGIAGVMPVLTAVLAEYSPKKYRAMIISTATLGAPGGAIMAIGTGMLLLGHYGMDWRSMFYVGFIPLFMIIINYLWVPNSMTYYLKKRDKNSIREILAKTTPEYIPQLDDEYEVRLLGKKVAKASFISLFQKGLVMNTIMLWLMMFFNLFIIFGLNVWIPKLMMGQGYNLGSSLIIMLMFNVGAFIGMPLVGWAADRWGYRRAIMTFYGFMAIVIALCGTKPPYEFLMAMLFCAGTAINGIQGTASAYVAVSYPPEIRGTAMGWAYAAGRVGGAFGPIVGGLAITMNFSFMSTLLIWAVGAAIGVLVVFLTKEQPSVDAVK